jgi:hypothetical protein
MINHEFRTFFANSVRHERIQEWGDMFFRLSVRFISEATEQNPLTFAIGNCLGEINSCAYQSTYPTLYITLEP